VADRFEGDPLTAPFASDVEWLIEWSQPAGWIHGHAHDAFNYSIGDMRIVFNPKAYPPDRGRACRRMRT
jgi:hypothetical protein